MLPTFKSDSYQPSGFFALRSPVLPFEAWTELGLLGKAPSAGAASPLGTVGDSLTEDLLSLLFVSSPGTVEALTATGDAGKKPDFRARLAALKYLLRMSTRSTPFGLLAGMSFGNVGANGEPGEISLAPRAAYECRWSIDSWLVAEFLRKHEPSFWRSSRLAVNSTAYRIGSEIRYLRFVGDPDDRGLPRIQLESVAVDQGIEALLASADGSARGLEVAARLASDLSSEDEEVPIVEAEEFVAASVEGGLLTCRELVWPVICDGSGLARLAEAWSAAEAAPEVVEGLRTVLRTLDGMGRLGDVSLGGLRTAAAAATSSIAPENFRRSPLQGDLFKPLQNGRLPRIVADEMQRAVSVLSRLYGDLERQALGEFRNRFVERFGEGRLVPLGLAVDEEYGVGFDSAGAGPSRSGLTRELPPRRRPPESVTWSAREKLLLHKVTEAGRRGARSIEVSSADVETVFLEDVQFRPPCLPPTYHVMGEVVAPSIEAVEEGRFLLVFRNLLGPSGARFLGRFSAWTPEVRRALAEHLRQDEEAAPDAVFAEIVHEGEGRLPNVVSRPALRRSVIEYLGYAAGDTETVLHTRDLLVTVVEGQIHLVSRSLGKRVIPRLSAAHDFDQSPLPAYRLLCALQSQGCTEWLSWRWGVLESLPFLPRVTAGRIVFSRARWILAAQDRSLVEESTCGLRSVRDAYDLPRWVFVGEQDRELLLDLDAAWARDVLLGEWPRGGVAALREALPSPEDLWLKGPEGRFFSELIVPFERGESPGRAQGPSVPRLIALNREVEDWGRRRWLFLKVYMEPQSLEAVLKQLSAQLEGDAEGARRRWFFVRYGDPEFHLRLRIELPVAEARRDALRSRIVDCLRRQGVCSEILEAEYRPEYFRYGGPEAFDSVEKLFVADSEFVLWLIRTDDLRHSRWQWLVWRLHATFDAWKLDLEQRISECEVARNELSFRLRLTIDEKRAIGAIARERGHAMDEVLATADGVNEGSAIEIRAYEGALDGTFSTLFGLEKAGRLLRDLRPIARSIMHMSVNRLAEEDALRTEAVVYELLLREYRRRYHLGRA